MRENRARWGPARSHYSLRLLLISLRSSRALIQVSYYEGLPGMSENAKK